MIYYIYYYWNSQFLNIVKTEVLLPKEWVILADFAYPV
jgi:hypothetical protein